MMAAWQKAESESDSNHVIVSASDDLPDELNATMWKSDTSGGAYEGDDSAYESEATLPKGAEAETLDEISMKKLLSKLKRSATLTVTLMLIDVIHAQSARACVLL